VVLSSSKSGEHSLIKGELTQNHISCEWY
jgi:hypothetical protein